MKSKNLLSNLFPFLLIISSISLTSCVKEEYDMNNLEAGDWNPDFALPLVYTDFSINDIVLRTDKNGNITTDANNFCTLIYKGTLFSINAQDFIVLPDQTKASSFSVTATEEAIFNALAPNTAASFTFTQVVNFLPGTTNTQIDSLLFASGNLDFQINKTFTAASTVEIRIPSAKKNGISFFDTLIIGAGTSSRSVDLSAYKFDMTNSGTQHNQFLVEFTIKVVKNAGSTMPAGSSLNFQENMSNQKFQTVFGNVGMQSTLTPNHDTVAISIFKHNNSPIGIGTFHFANPLLKLYLTNSFGLPVGISNIDLQWYNPGFGQGNITYTSTPLQVNAPTVVGGAEVSDTLKLNNSNSDFNAAMDKRPKFIIYNVASLTNPLSMPPQTNFVDAGSKLKANVEVILPMYGNAKDFTFEDTLRFRFNKVENVESILFKAFAQNDFPMGIRMQIYFTDSNYVTIDSLFTNSSSNDPTNVLPSAQITFNPDSSQSSIASSKVTDVRFNTERSHRLKTAKYIIIRAVSSTFGDGTKNVKIYSDKRLLVKLGARAQMNIPIK